MTETHKNQLQELEDQRNQALQQVQQLYDGRQQAMDELLRQQTQAVLDHSATQARLQQENADLAQAQLRAARDQAEADYQREQQGAWVDHQREQAAHGVGAEAVAAEGLQGSGYAASLTAGSYSAYQDRLAAARSAWQSTAAEYDRAMAQARLQNSAQLATLANAALKSQLCLALEALTRTHELQDDLARAREDVDARYDELLEALQQRQQQELSWQTSSGANAGPEPVVQAEPAKRQPLSAITIQTATGLASGLLLHARDWRMYVKQEPQPSDRPIRKLVE